MTVKKISVQEYNKIKFNRFTYTWGLMIVLVTTLFVATFVNSQVPGISYYEIVNGAEVLVNATPPLAYFAGAVGMLAGLGLLFVPFFFITVPNGKGKIVRGTYKGQEVEYCEFELEGFDANAANERYEVRKAEKELASA